MITRREFSALLIGGLCAVAWPALAQPFPSKPIRIIVPAAPGGGADILARALTSDLGTVWGQTIVVENKSGGAGGIGTRAVISAVGDGHTLLLGSTTSIMSLVKDTNKPYDVRRELASVTLISAAPYLFVAHPSVPQKNAAELIAYAKQNPGKLVYGSSGGGATSHLSGALFAQMAGIDMLHVPYRGIGAVMIDLLAGRVQLLVSPAPPVIPHIRAGKLKVIGTTGDARSGLFPEYPTIAESGLPGYSSIGSFGLFAPTSTPPAVVAKISADVGKVLRSSEVKERFAGQGDEPAPSTPEEYRALVNATVAKWIDVGRKAGIKFGE